MAQVSNAVILETADYRLDGVTMFAIIIRMNATNAILLGTSEEVTTCDCCGKSNLKLTVAISLDGSVVYYGRDCAAKAFRVLRSGSWSHKATASAIVANAQNYRPERTPIALV